MNDVIKMLESQGYREGGVLHFEGGGKPSVPTAPQQEQAAPVEEKPFVEPDWVSKAPSVIGTAVEPIYPTKIVHNGNLAPDTSKAPVGYRYDNGKSQYVNLDLNGNVTDIQNRGNLISQIGDMAKTVAPIALAAMSAGALGPELSTWIKGLQGANALTHGDVLGGLSNLSGLGGYSEAGQYLNAAKAVKSGDPLAMLGSAANLSGSEDLQELTKDASIAKSLAKGDIKSIGNALASYTGIPELGTAAGGAAFLTALNKSSGSSQPATIQDLVAQVTSKAPASTTETTTPVATAPTGYQLPPDLFANSKTVDLGELYDLSSGKKPTSKDKSTALKYFDVESPDYSVDEILQNLRD